MLEKRSWDIAPNARKQHAPAAPVSPGVSRARGAHDIRSQKKAAAEPKPHKAHKKDVTITRAKKVRPEPTESLKKRRTNLQKALLIVGGIVTVILIGLLVYLAWLPMLRVDAVSASGPHAEEIKQIATNTITGTHAYVLPRNSLFFIPESDIRAAILATYADVEAVSIKTNGLNELAIHVTSRSSAFLWCGTAYDALESSCYLANAEGLVFAQAQSTSTTPDAPLRIYAPLIYTEEGNPIRATISQASNIPSVLRLIKALQTLGADITSIAFRDDEADLYTEAGTRITYVIGKEQEAANTAASVFSQLSLNDGSIHYVDLRFSGKAYFKRSASVE